MEKFLESVAADLWQRYGTDVERLKVILPNVRTRVYLNEALTRLASKPLFAPEFISIDSLMCSLAGLERIDSIGAVTILHSVYKTHHDEEFDSFYRWGEVLLSDYDSIDKYLIDAAMLFRNIVDLREVDADLEAYLDEEQLAAVRRFWREFDSSRKSSRHKESFLSIWRSLLPIYTTFRQRLEDMGVGYTGMIYRRAAERLRSDEAVLPSARYVVVGFNALSATEKVLFDHLKSAHEADFYWDYDDYYIKDDKQEAGLFLRENMRRYPAPATFHPQSCFCEPKEVKVVATASDSLQCKYVGEFIDELIEREGRVDKNTAIVLTDEGLLSPLLYSIPDAAGKVNVTMGYPLKATIAYSFAERLLQLQLRARTTKAGKRSFYHSDVVGLLSHPYMMAAAGEESSKLRSELVRRGHIYIENKNLLGRNELIDTIFSHHTDRDSLREYLLCVLSRVASVQLPQQDKNQRNLGRESITLISEAVARLDNSLSRCSVEMKLQTYVSLLRRVMQGMRIPYSGEPLSGVQVMGILETRNLDFDNVLLLSMNDDNFPSGRISDTSFIPYNLRFAYGLPTPRHSEGVYAYYFYRLLQRAHRVDMVYCAVAGERASGENSRYIYQLEFESPHKVERVEKNLNVNLSESPDFRVEKKGEVLRRLRAYLGTDGNEPERKISPSTLNGYLSCSLKFYFKAIAGIRPDEEIDEDVDDALFGSTFHKAMELLYTPLTQADAPSREHIASLSDEDVHKAVKEAIDEVCFDGDEVPEEEYGGKLIVVRDTVERYIKQCVLTYDSAPERGDFRVYKLEHPMTTSVECRHGKVTFYGESDRLDVMPDGSLRIIDYKTGSIHKDFAGLASLVEREGKQLNGAALQTLIYSLMATRMQQAGEIAGKGVTPSLYYVRYMGKEEYSPLLNDTAEGHEVATYEDYAEVFEPTLSGLLDELFDPTVPFASTSNRVSCDWCDFSSICRRGKK